MKVRSKILPVLKNTESFHRYALKGIFMCKLEMSCISGVDVFETLVRGSRYQKYTHEILSSITSSALFNYFNNYSYVFIYFVLGLEKLSIFIPSTFTKTRV
jgi:hypothetical protein